MKNFFSRIKNGIGKVLTNIKKKFVNLKEKIKNVFNKIRNRNERNQENIKIGSNSTVSNEKMKNIVNERKTILKDSKPPLNNDTKFRINGTDAMLVPIVVNKIKNNITPQRKNSNIINQNNEDYSQEEMDTTISNENADRVVSIEIKENIGIVDFKTITGKKYQKNIDDILKEKKTIYKNWNINKKCNDFTKNKIQELRLKRRLDPVVISTLNNEEDIDKYLKCVRDTEKIWFNLEHNLIDSKIKGKNARVMKRAGRYEERIGAKVKRKESLLERMLKKIKNRNKEPGEMEEELSVIEKDNKKLNEIEEDIKDLNREEDKKSRKEEKLERKEEKKLAKKEFKERYVSYAVLIKKLYDLKPRRKLNEIMNDVVDRDLYNLTDKDAWTRAVATFNVGHKLSMIKPIEAKRYLISAYAQFNNEELLAKNEETFQYLEDVLLNLQGIYIREEEYKEAAKLNVEYMRIVEREKKEKINPMLLESRKNGSQIKEIDLMIDYRKKYVAGQKAEMKRLYKAGYKFEAEELYRKILNESGIVMTDEAYDLSIKENCIENGKYIVIDDNGITYREPILGNEKYLLLKNKQIQQLIKNKINNGIMTAAKAETVLNGTKIPSIGEEKGVKDDTKKKGVLAKIKQVAKVVVDNIAKEEQIKTEIKEKKIEEEKIEEAKAEQNKIEEAGERIKEEKRKIEEQKKDEIAEFNKRYNDYNILSKGILGEEAKKDIQDIRNDIVHNDIYNMTSNDETTKGIATFRVGHRLATLPTKKKEAERLLRTATSILNRDDVLAKDDSLIGILQNAHMDLGQLYLMNNDYIDAEKSFVDYMETVRKEKIERYDPKIIEAKKNGKIIDEIDLWIEVKAKFTVGKKSMIKLLSKSGKMEEAEKLYKKLLADCKISLSDEEYQLSVETNCIENGKYMRIANGRTYREPILGNEYLLLRRRNISNKALEDR